MKFKIGDRVRVVSPPCSVTGKVGELRAVDTGKAFPYLVRIGGWGRWWFGAEELEPAWGVDEVEHRNDCRKALDDAFDAARERHEAGFETYGTESWDSAVGMSVKDMQEEALDLINYGAMLYDKLKRLSVRLEAVRELWGPPAHEED